MVIASARVQAGGRVTIPLEIRRRFVIDEGTRVAFLEEKGCLVVQPVNNAFIDAMKGVLGQRGLPRRVGRETDRQLR